MTEWVSQAEAVRLLEELGDKISQPALSQYLKGHPEVVRRDGGPGRAQQIDWNSLKTSRATRSSRGPASQAALALPEPEARRSPAKSEETIDLSARRARADTDKAESDARRARILADEAEGRSIPKDVAINAFITAGLALTRAFEENRARAVDAIRASVDPREGSAAMREYETAVRTAFANALTDFAASADPALAAAE